MKQKCVDAVESAAGRPLRAGEAKDITDRINKNYRILAQTRPDEFSAMSHEQKLQEAARMAAEELKSDAIKEKQRIALKIKAFDNVDKYATQQKKLGISKIESLKRIMASYSDGKSNIQSVEMRGSAIAKLSISRMLKTLEAIQPKALGLFANKEGTKALTYALYGEHDKIENPELRKIATIAAEQWLKVAENLRKAFNSAGGQIGKLENWAYPQNHSQNIIAKAGREKWVNDILPALDRKKYINEDFTYMNDSQMREFLGKSWENIATGGANKADLKDNLQPSMKARRHAEERVLHFKDADSFLGYQDKYAEKDTYTTIVNHMDRLSKDIAMLDVLGPNPDAMFKTLLNKYVAEEAKAEPLKAKKILKKATSAQNLYDYIAGKTIPVASEAIARTFDTAQNLIIASHMGTAIVTSLPHSAAMHVTAAIQGMSSFKMMRNQLDTYNPLNKTERHIAERAGLALDTFTSQINRWGTDSLGAMFSQKLSNLTMRVSGFNAIIEARKRAFGVTMYGAIGKSLQDNARLADLPKWDKRMLESKGTTETHFQVWKKAELEDWGRGNNTMITPESIYRIPDEQLQHLGDPATLRKEAALQLLGHVLEETNMAIVTATAAERASMMQGIQRGTLKGELARSFYLFKGFPIAVFSKHLNRAWNMPTNSSRAAYAMSFIAGTTLLGAASVQIFQLLTGKDPYNMTNDKYGVDPRFLGMAFLKGGAMGIYGDFLFNTETSYGSSPLATFAGPLTGSIDDLFRLTQGNLLKKGAGQNTTFKSDLVRNIKNNIPLQNLWYTRAAMDRLIFNQLQEMASPGYMDRVEERARNTYNQRYWWHLKDTTPSRAPDFQRALGQ